MNDCSLRFTPGLAQAIAEGRKTVTRRHVVGSRNRPSFGPGDRLWVREKWCLAIDPITSQSFEPRRALYCGVATEQVLLDDGEGVRL